MPDLAIYMHDHYDPHGTDIQSMFGLNSLNLVEDAHGLVDWDITIHEDEIADIMKIRFDQWEETTAIMEAYEKEFYDELDAAWSDYVEDTTATVEMEAALHREVVNETIDYLWDRSAYPVPSLDDVYPRPSVAFAAKNARKINANPTTSPNQYYAAAAVGTLALSSVLAYSISKSSTKTQPETLL